MGASWGDPEAEREMHEAYEELKDSFPNAKMSYTHHSMGWENPPRSAFSLDPPGERIYSMYSHGGLREDGTAYEVTRVCTDVGNFIQHNGGPWEPWVGDPEPSFWDRVKEKFHIWRFRLFDKTWRK